METQKELEAGYVVLTEEPNQMRAHWIANAVEAEGIPTFVDEDNLMDEFAISQKIMGLLPVRVLVPADRLTEARTVFLNLSQPVPLVDEEEEDELPAEPRSRLTMARAMRITLLCFVAVAGAFLIAHSCGWTPGA